jgi:FkbM family methyltransferase
MHATRDGAPMWAGTNVTSRAYLSYLRDLPYVRGKLRLARAVVDRLSSLGIVGENGARFELDPKDWISWIIARDGAYEPYTLKLASKLISGGGTLLDIGAAWGLYTCSLGVLPGVDVIAVEPTARSFERLSGNVSRNGVRAKLINAALGPSMGLVEMGIDVDGNDLTARVSERGDRFVASITPSSMLQTAGATHIRLLKIDVEGYEWPILEAYPWGALSPDWLIVELYDKYLAERDMTRADALRFLADRGYEARESHEDNVFFELR